MIKRKEVLLYFSLKAVLQNIRFFYASMFNTDEFESSAENVIIFAKYEKANFLMEYAVIGLY